jgi:hypothetical protein
LGQDCSKPLENDGATGGETRDLTSLTMEIQSANFADFAVCFLKD